MISRILKTTLCLIPLTASLAMAETSPEAVIGAWQTEAAGRPTPDGGTAYLRTETSFTREKQKLVLSIYADPELKTKIFEYSSGGSWDPQGPAEGVAGAMAVNMVNEYSLATIFIDAPQLLTALNLAECKLVVGQATDITDCVKGPPFGQAACVDLDIIMVDQGGQRLRYGGGGVDRCVTRPTELSTDAFFRVK